MQRRELLQFLTATGAAPLLTGLTHATNIEADTATVANWQADFMASTAPWKIGFDTVQADIPLTRAAVTGRFPDAVAGTLFRVGPAGHELGGERYHHWFDGDGMMNRFVIEGTQVHHQARYVATPKRIAEQGAGHRLTEAFGTIPPGAQATTSADSINVANTSVLSVQGELLALWEGGSATRVDARTLDTLGTKVWRADLAGMPFSAHPKVDPDGTIWNFGVGSLSSMLALYEIAPDGVLRRATVMPLVDAPMVHDFAVTAHHLVFLMPPLVFDRKRKEAGATFLDSHVWRPELGMRVLVVDKADWSRRQMLTLPAGFLFHVGNAWEQNTPNGLLIHIDYVRSDNAESVFTTNREVMRGRLARSDSESRLTVATLNLTTGQATQETFPFTAEFPCIDPRQVGLRHRNIVHATQRVPQRPGFGAIARTNIETGQSQRFIYGAQRMVEEHVFVPDGNGPGWILGTVLDIAQKKTVLSCFAADQLAAGPVAQATLSYPLPLGLHGIFVAG